MQHRIDGVPLLGQNHGVAAALHVRQQHLAKQKRRQRRGVVGSLALFTVVHPGGVILTDPLTPPVQPEVSPAFMPSEGRVADKPQMGLEAGGGEGLTQPTDAARNATRPGILVRAFETQNVKLQRKRRTSRSARALTGRLLSGLASPHLTSPSGYNQRRQWPRLDASGDSLPTP